jgi:hypothetical protein
MWGGPNALNREHEAGYRRGGGDADQADQHVHEGEGGQRHAEDHATLWACVLLKAGITCSPNRRIEAMFALVAHGAEAGLAEQMPDADVAQLRHLLAHRLGEP